MAEDTTAALIAQGDALLAENRAAEAFEAYDLAIDALPDDGSLLLRAGMALLQAGAFQPAYLYLEQAQHAMSDDPEVWRLMGTAALAAGQGAQARAALEACREAGGQATPDLLLDLASAAYWDLDRDGALAYAREAAALAPDNAEAAAWVAKLEPFGDDHDFLVDVARGHARQGRYRMAARLFEIAFTLGDSFDARLYGGRAMLAAGRPRDAVELLEAAHDMRPDDLEAERDLAVALTIVDDIDRPGAVTPPPAQTPAATPVPPPPLPTARFCSECGTQLRTTSQFCPSCGRPVRGRS